VQIYAESSDLTNVFITNLLNCFRKKQSQGYWRKSPNRFIKGRLSIFPL